MVCDVYCSFFETLTKELCSYTYIFLKSQKLFLYIINLFKYLQLLTELMYLSLSKLTSTHVKRVVLIFLYTLYQKYQSHHFPIHS